MAKNVDSFDNTQSSSPDAKLIFNFHFLSFYFMPMRGSEKLKKIEKLNTDSKSLLVKSLAIYNAIMIFFYWHNKKSWIQFLLVSPMEIIGVVLIFRFCKPVIKKENGVEKLENIISVNSEGPVSFFWDLIFWGMVGKFAIIFGLKFMVIYLGIPLSFFYEFLYKPYQKIKKCN